MSNKQAAITIACLAAVLQTGDVSRADFITTKFGSGTPENSWAYSKAGAIGQGNSTTYIVSGGETWYQDGGREWGGPLEVDRGGVDRRGDGLAESVVSE